MSPATTASQPKGLRQRVGQSRLGTLLVLAVTAAIVMGGAFVIDRPAAAKTGVSAVTVAAGDGPAPTIGSAAQNFTATTVDGKKVSLSSYKGHPVWVTFGASWCGACQAEAPDVEATYEKYRAAGVVVLAVSIQENSQTVLDYGKRLGLTYPQVADANDTIAAAYRVNGIPAHFFIDKSGILRSMKTGALSPDQMDATLKGITQ